MMGTSGNGTTSPVNNLHKRKEQLSAWEISDANKASSDIKNPQRVKFKPEVAFLAACNATDFDEVARFLTDKVDINTSNIDGLTALHQACIDNKLDLIKFLIEHGADIHARDSEGWTPLHATALGGHTEVAKYLLTEGAKVGIANNDGDLPIDVAESWDMKQLLKESMAKIDENRARNAEALAMQKDARAWLKEGRYRCVRDPRSHASPLHVAAAKGYSIVLTTLLQCPGVDINDRDSDGWTPLHAAAHWGQESACRVLAAHGADMAAVTHANQTVLDIAEEDLTGLLQELQAKQTELMKQESAKQPTIITSVKDEDGAKPYTSRRSSVTRVTQSERHDLTSKIAEIEKHPESLGKQQQQQQQPAASAAAVDAQPSPEAAAEAAALSRPPISPRFRAAGAGAAAAAAAAPRQLTPPKEEPPTPIPELEPPATAPSPGVVEEVVEGGGSATAAAAGPPPRSTSERRRQRAEAAAAAAAATAAAAAAAANKASVHSPSPEEPQQPQPQQQQQPEPEPVAEVAPADAAADSVVEVTLDLPEPPVPEPEPEVEPAPPPPPLSPPPAAAEPTPGLAGVPDAAAAAGRRLPADLSPSSTPSVKNLLRRMESLHGNQQNGGVSGQPAKRSQSQRGSFVQDRQLRNSSFRSSYLMFAKVEPAEPAQPDNSQTAASPDGDGDGDVDAAALGVGMASLADRRVSAIMEKEKVEESETERRRISRRNRATKRATQGVSQDVVEQAMKLVEERRAAAAAAEAVAEATDGAAAVGAANGELSHTAPAAIDAASATDAATATAADAAITAAVSIPAALPAESAAATPATPGRYSRLGRRQMTTGVPTASGESDSGRGSTQAIAASSTPSVAADSQATAGVIGLSRARPGSYHGSVAAAAASSAACGDDSQIDYKRLYEKEKANSDRLSAENTRLRDENEQLKRLTSEQRQVDKRLSEYEAQNRAAAAQSECDRLRLENGKLRADNLSLIRVANRLRALPTANVAS